MEQNHEIVADPTPKHELSLLVAPLSDAIDHYLNIEPWTDTESADGLQMLHIEQARVLMRLHEYASVHGIAVNDIAQRNALAMACDRWMQVGKNPLKVVSPHGADIAPDEIIRKTTQQFGESTEQQSEQTARFIEWTNELASYVSSLSPEVNGVAAFVTDRPQLLCEDAGIREMSLKLLRKIYSE